MMSAVRTWVWGLALGCNLLAVSAAYAEDSAPKPIPLNWVTPDAAMAIVIRPRAIWADPQLRATIEAALPKALWEELPKIIGPLEDIESALIVLPHCKDLAVGEPTFFYTQVKPGDWDVYLPKMHPGIKKFTVDGPAEQANAPTQNIDFGSGRGYYVIDAHTIVLGPDDTLQKTIQTIQTGATPVWAAAWKESDIGQVSLFVSLPWFQEKILNDRVGKDRMLLNLALPLAEEASFITAGISVVGNVRLQARAVCRNPEGAQNVRDTTQAILTLAGNSLRVGPLRQENELSQIAEPALKIARSMLQESRLSVEDKQAILDIQSPVTAVEMMAALKPVFVPQTAKKQQPTRTVIAQQPAVAPAARAVVAQQP